MFPLHRQSQLENQFSFPNSKSKHPVNQLSSPVACKTHMTTSRIPSYMCVSVYLYLLFAQIVLQQNEIYSSRYTEKTVQIKKSISPIYSLSFLPVSLSDDVQCFPKGLFPCQWNWRKKSHAAVPVVLLFHLQLPSWVLAREISFLCFQFPFFSLQVCRENQVYMQYCIQCSQEHSPVNDFPILIFATRNRFSSLII